jgi:hypothetical protein
MTLTSLEKAVLEKLLDGDNAFLMTLRQQLTHVVVASREMTGVGFYADLAVAPGAPRIAGRPSFKFGDVQGTASNLKHGIGFLLYVGDGALSTLEGYTYDEPWPDEVQNLSLTYSGGAVRRLDAIIRLMH